MPNKSTKSYQSKYFKKWYKENRDKILARRRERYWSDDEFRARAQASSADASAKRKAEEAEERKNNPVDPKPKIVKMRWGRYNVRVYGIDVLCQAIGKSRKTIYSWERKGWLPKTPLDIGGKRMYTSCMINIVARTVDELSKEGLSRGRRAFDGSEMKERIWTEWERIRKLGGEECEPFNLQGNGNVRVPLVPRPVTFEVLGEEVQAYTAGHLARALGKKGYEDIFALEAKGILPKTPLRSDPIRKRRLYTSGMVKTVVSAFQRIGECEEAFNVILEGWNALGITVD